MKNVLALAGMLALSLVASVALAQKTDPASKYAVSSPAGIAPKSGVIKFLRDCPVGTDAFFKNVSPFISGGPGGDTGEYLWEGVFPVDGSEVTLNVYWKADNSYRFEAFGGVVWAVGPEIDSDKLIYEFDTPVFADGGHNVLLSGDSAAVNHLDLCLSLVDTTPPVIEFIEPLDGDTVSGIVTVIVTATDPSGVDPNSVTVSVNGGTPVSMTCTEKSATQYECKYDWLTTEPGEELPAGTYTITVEAKDGAVPVQNTATVTITVDLVNSLSSCFGILGDEDFTGVVLPDGYANGCKPTPLANVQAPPYTKACNPELQLPEYIIPAFCYISGKQ
ncbi:MAG: Ig-like domain-containing protein, partial [Woeseiaceae bacterium]|nr:Ig-like domain-containing protein [Woeseiaceae bacterium]